MSEMELVTRDEWVKIVKSRIGSSEFEILNTKTNRLTTTGGYLGEHYLGEVTVRDESSQKTRVLNFFIKIKPYSSEKQLEIVELTSAFQKEVDALSTIFVELRSSLENDGKNMEWMCECFYTRPGLIVTEDLTVQQYRVFGARDTLEFKHFALTMKIVANMHSASLIYEEKHPSQPFRIGDVYSESLVEALFRHVPDSPLHPGSLWLNASIETVWLLVELILGKGALLRMKTELETAMSLLFDLEKPSQRFRNVVCHGDLKRDNILFRYENDQPVEARLVDFQFIRYAPPANDLMCFLYISTSPKFRKEYEEQLLTLYYEQMSSNLRHHDIDPNEVLPFSEFMESCNYYRILGVLLTSCYSPGTLLKEEHICHIFSSSEDYVRFFSHDRSPEVKRGFTTDQFYRERVTEVIKELIEECIYKKSFKNI